MSVCLWCSAALASLARHESEETGAGESSGGRRVTRRCICVSVIMHAVMSESVAWGRVKAVVPRTIAHVVRSRRGVNDD